MNSLIKNNAVCPACWSRDLSWDDESSSHCLSCGSSYPVRNNIWFAIVPDNSWKPILQDTIALFMDFTYNRDAANALLGQKMQQSIEDYSEEHESIRDASFHDAWNCLSIKHDAHILEVGAGDLRVASDLCKKGYSIVALEPVPEFLERGKYDAGLPIAKVCSSASRLPFKSGTFDVVYSLATLHHVDDISSIVREMSRVLKPGGVLLAGVEPVSAIFRNIKRLRETTPEFSFDIGIHEQVPRFLSYVTAMKKAGISEIQAHAFPEACRLPQRLSRFKAISALLPQGRLNRGLKMYLRHCFTHGDVSLVGNRSQKDISPPPPVTKDRFLFSPEDYIYRRDRQHLTGIWKTLLKKEEAPGAIIVGENDLDLLRRGFSRREYEGDGFPYKWLFAQGAFFLTVKPGHTGLTVTLTFPDETFSLEAFMDSESLPSLPAQQSDPRNGWKRVRWNLPEGMNHGVKEFLLRASRIRELNGMPVSVKIHSIRLD